MQPVDFTTLAAIGVDLRATWLPARCEQFYQRDRYTLFIALRTLDQRGWLSVSWPPQAASIHMDTVARMFIRRLFAVSSLPSMSRLTIGRAALLLSQARSKK